MAVAPVELDSVSIEQRISSFKNRSEVVIYYRKPEFHHGTGERMLEAGWITWSDSQTGKRADLLMEGWTPLPQLGRVWDNDKHFQYYGPWGPLLAHPQGPAMLPVDQVVTYRWYRKERLWTPGYLKFPVDELCAGCGGVHHVRFPQITGEKFVEYDCPECNSRTFFEPNHMARHLRNSHGYDRVEIEALGRAMGIDFSKELALGGVIEFEYTPMLVEPEPDEQVGEAPAVVIEKIAVPLVRHGGGGVGGGSAKKPMSEKQLAALNAGREKRRGR